MARLSALAKGDLDKAPIKALRTKMGDVAFERDLDQSSAQCHAKARAAWQAGDKAEHDRLLQVGWLLRRQEQRAARTEAER